MDSTGRRSSNSVKLFQAHTGGQVAGHVHSDFRCVVVRPAKNEHLPMKMKIANLGYALHCELPADKGLTSKPMHEMYKALA